MRTPRSFNSAWAFALGIAAVCLHLMLWPVYVKWEEKVVALIVFGLGQLCGWMALTFAVRGFLLPTETGERSMKGLASAGATLFLLQLAVGVWFILDLMTTPEIQVIPGRPKRRNGKREPLTETGWARDAEAERASIQSFEDLAETLTQLRAPQSLVDRVHQAAVEEARHAAATQRFARVPMRNKSVNDDAARRRQTRRELVGETLLDGCLNEAYAAALAAAVEADGELGALMEMVARDEASHAELSWDVLEWCLQEGGKWTLLWGIAKLPRRAAAWHPELLTLRTQTHIYRLVRKQTIRRAARLLS